MAVLRPAAKSKSIRGLYLTGSSTHPGGGVPTTVASGLITAAPDRALRSINLHEVTATLKVTVT